MGSSFGSYEIARSGMFVNERGLSVTGHNIANVNTPGFTRQQSIFKTSFYQGNFSNMQVGTGVSVEQTRQIRHTFLDNTYRKENQSLGYSEARNSTYIEIQNILGEPMNKGLQDTMNQFWDSWQELSKDTSSLTVRALVRQRGQALVDYVNHMGTQIDRLQNDLNSKIVSEINEVNDITGQIADLNVEIPKVESSGDRANDLRDQRNVLLDRLTKLVNAEITEKENGEVDVTVGGYYLVNKKESTNIIAKNTATSGMFYTPLLEGSNLPLELKNGSIKGLLESRGEVYGAVGSIENGTVNANMDITFAVDVSTGTDLTKIKANIDAYLNQLGTPNVNTKLRLVTYSDGVLSNNTYATVADFKTAVAGLTNSGTNKNFGSVVTALGANTYAAGADRYTVVFTDKSIDGNTVTDPTTYINNLKTLDMRVSVVTDSQYFNVGQPGESGWDAITNQTGGRLYATDTSDYKAMMDTIGTDLVSESVSSHMKDTTNIVPDLRQRLNALINIIAREVNSLQRSGMTIHTTPNQGTDFFVATDSSRPIEMGNISLNSNLSDLNNIISAKYGDKGDNSLALQIANLRHKDCTGDYTERLSMDEFYQGIIQNIGNNAQEVRTFTEGQSGLVESADNQRKAISNVSMDEEMSMMLKYQFAYGGASKAFNAIDEMIDTVVNRMGMVGR